jgi:tetratricopeptide (TPR) repeat protein
VVQGAPAAFFSYCRQDSDFAIRLAGDLKAAGAGVWLDQLDIAPGQRWDHAVEDALTSSPRMLVILSPASVDSTNVMDEVSFALEEKKTVIPVMHKDCVVPFRLRRLQYVDFRQDYARGLKELVKTLFFEQKVEHSETAISDVHKQSQTDVTEAGKLERAAEEKLFPDGALLQQKKKERAPGKTQEPEREEAAADAAVELSNTNVSDARQMAQPEIELPLAKEVTPDASPSAAHYEDSVTLLSPVSGLRAEAGLPALVSPRIVKETGTPTGSRSALRLVIMTSIAVVLLGAGSWWYWSFRPQAKAAGQLNEGIVLYRNSRFPGASNLFQAAVHQDPNLIRGWLYLGASYAQQCFATPEDPQGDPQMCLGAKGSFEQALSVDPGNALASAAIGSMYVQMNDFDKAKGQFRQLMKNDRSNSVPYVWIGSVDWTICYRHTSELVKRLYGRRDRGGAPLPEQARAELEKQNGPLVIEGIEMLSKALELRPHDDNAMAFLSLIYRQRAELEQDVGARSEDVNKADDLVNSAIKERQKAAEGTTAQVDEDFDFAVQPKLPPPPPPKI